MAPALPRPIAAYIEANAALDVEGMLSPFADDAIVYDDHGRHRGRAELRAWLEGSVIAAKAVFTPDTLRQERGQFVVEGPTHGDFKGSPIRFTFCFTLRSDTIETLEITT